MKHDFETRLAAVRYCLDGHAGIQATAAKFNLSHTCLCHWINLYRHHGERALAPGQKRYYSPDFKLSVVQFALEGHESVPCVAARFNIPSHKTVKNWLKMYQNKERRFFHQNHRIGGKKMADNTEHPGRDEPATYEQMQKELRYLRAENAYLKGMQALLLEKKRREQEKKQK